jgi:uncharacterized membrane protein
MRSKPLDKPHPPLVPLIIVLLVTAVVFAPVCVAEFSGMDDAGNLVKNPRMNPPGLSAVGWYWSHSFADLYIPITYTIWSAIAAVARTPTADGAMELNSYIFHTVNLLFHLGSAAVVFFILRRLVGRDWPASLGALLFAIHPVQVESVAWVSGLKDVQAGLF